MGPLAGEPPVDLLRAGWWQLVYGLACRAVGNCPNGAWPKITKHMCPQPAETLDKRSGGDSHVGPMLHRSGVWFDMSALGQCSSLSGALGQMPNTVQNATTLVQQSKKVLREWVRRRASDFFVGGRGGWTFVRPPSEGPRTISRSFPRAGNSTRTSVFDGVRPCSEGPVFDGSRNCDGVGGVAPYTATIS